MNSWVRSIAIQPDGKIVLLGDFNLVGGLSRLRLARLSSITAAQDELVIDENGSSISWRRAGAGPEVLPVTFESSNDGETFIPIGAESAAMMAGNWRGWHSPNAKICGCVYVDFILRAFATVLVQWSSLWLVCIYRYLQLS